MVIPLSLDTHKRTELVIEIHDGRGVLAHPNFGFVIGWMRVAEQFGRVMPKLDDLFDHGDVLLPGPPLVRQPNLLPRRFILAIVHDRQELGIRHADQIDIA